MSYSSQPVRLFRDSLGINNNGVAKDEALLLCYHLTSFNTNILLQTCVFCLLNCCVFPKQRLLFQKKRLVAISFLFI